MGKKRNRSNNNNKQQQQPKKKQRRHHNANAYWIEDFRESPGDVSHAALTILVSSVELTDDHTHHKKESEKESLTEPVSTCNEVGESEVAAVANAKEGESNAVTDSKEPDTNVEEETKDKILKENNNAIDSSAKAEETNEEHTTNLAVEDKVQEKARDLQVHPPDTQQQETTGDTATEGAVAKESDKEKKKSNGIYICLRRDASALKKRKKFKRQNFKPLPNGDCGDGIVNPFPKHVVDDKYWAQRHRLFSKFDQGIQLDRESWYSVTPEAIALHIAQKIIQQSNPNENGLVVLDAFCGAGGNAIALARQERIALVICVDLDEEKLKLAANNARIYDVPHEKLLFLHADACDVLQKYQKGDIIRNNSEEESASSDEKQQLQGYKTGGLELLPERVHSVFFSPPWGGTGYETIGPKKYDLKCVKLEDETDGEQLLAYAHNAVPQNGGTIAVFLPRNTNGMELGRSAVRVGISGVVEMEQNILNNKFKAITVYAGGSEKTANENG